MDEHLDALDIKIPSKNGNNNENVRE